MGRYYPVRCARTVREQKYIRAKLDLWDKLPREEQEYVMALISDIAQGDVERSALEAVVLRGSSSRTAAEVHRLGKGRVYQMFREFLEEFEL